MNDTLRSKISKVLGEPATGSRGQGGLPIHGSVVDYEMYFTKAGKEHLVNEILTAFKAHLQTLELPSKLEQPHTFTNDGTTAGYNKALDDVKKAIADWASNF